MSGAWRSRWGGWRSAVAAGLVLAATVAVLVMVSLGGRAAQASPGDLARLYADATKPGAMMMKVATIAEANRVLAGQGDLPEMPVMQPGQLHACCIHDFMDSKVVCLMLRDGDVPLTLVIGHSREFKPAAGRLVERGGRKYTVHEVNGLRMVMTSESGTFVCLMGEVGEERLLEVAGGLKF